MCVWDYAIKFASGAVWCEVRLAGRGTTCLFC